jgi:hypothetical protein
LTCGTVLYLSGNKYNTNQTNKYVNLYLRTETKSNIRNVVFNKKTWTIDNVQKVNYYNRLRVDYLGLEVRFPAGQEVCLFSIASGTVPGPTQPPIQLVSGAVSPRIKRPRRESDHSPSSSTKVKKGGAIPPLPHTSSWSGA